MILNVLKVTAKLRTFISKLLAHFLHSFAHFRQNDVFGANWGIKKPSKINFDGFHL